MLSNWFLPASDGVPWICYGGFILRLPFPFHVVPLPIASRRIVRPREACRWPACRSRVSLGEYLTRWGPGLLRLGAIMSFGGYCVSRPGLLRLGAVVG